VAAVLERLARPRLEEDPDALVEVGAAVLPRRAEHGVLLRPVAQPEDGADPAAAEEVEYGEVLGHPQRVVQGQQQGPDGDGYPLRPPGDGRRGHHRRGEEAVLGAVVLGEDHAADPDAIGPGRHVEGGLVQLGRGGRSEGGGTRVEADGAEHRTSSAEATAGP
jgi:hypothetical protein